MSAPPRTLLSAPALAIAATKSTAEKGSVEGPVSRSTVLFRIKILCRTVAVSETAAPTPRRISEGMMDVYSEPMLYTTAWQSSLMADTTFGFAGGRISWPYGLMYQMRSMREGRSSSSVLLKMMFCLRRVGKDPGRLASSTKSWSSASCVIGEVTSGRAVGSDGWEIAFWPVITVPFARAALM